MPQELIYTSVPKGLKSGSSGFSTVLHTAGMAPNLIGRLESLSGYTYLFPPDSNQAGLNPAVLTHYKLELAGKTFHVISRNAPYGMDYTGRSNNLAHHIVFQTNEELPSCGPAPLLQRSMETKFTGTPRVIPFSREISFPIPPRSNCPTWQRVSGDAGWAAHLADTAQTDQIAVVLYKPGTDTTALVSEALHLLPQNERWRVTFSTCFTVLQAGLKCQWRFVPLIPGEKPKVPPKALVLDLTKPLGEAPDSPLAELARTGKLPQTAQKSAIPSVRSIPAASSAKEEGRKPRQERAPKGPMEIPAGSFNPKKVYVPKKKKSRLLWWISGFVVLLLLSALGFSMVLIAQKQLAEVSLLTEDEPFVNEEETTKPEETLPEEEIKEQPPQEFVPETEEAPVSRQTPYEKIVKIQVGDKGAESERTLERLDDKFICKWGKKCEIDVQPIEGESQVEKKGEWFCLDGQQVLTLENHKNLKFMKCDSLDDFLDHYKVVIREWKYELAIVGEKPLNLEILLGEGGNVPLDSNIDIGKLKLEDKNDDFIFNAQDLRIEKKSTNEILLTFDCKGYAFQKESSCSADLLHEFCSHCKFKVDQQLVRVPVYISNELVSYLENIPKEGKSANFYILEYAVPGNTTGTPYLRNDTESMEVQLTTPKQEDEPQRFQDINIKYEDKKSKGKIITLSGMKKNFRGVRLCFEEVEAPKVEKVEVISLKQMAKEDFWYDSMYTLPKALKVQARGFMLSDDQQNLISDNDRQIVLTFTKKPEKEPFQIKVPGNPKLAKIGLEYDDGFTPKLYTIFLTPPKYDQEKLSLVKKVGVGANPGQRLVLVSCSNVKPVIRVNIDNIDQDLEFFPKIDERDRTVVFFTSNKHLLRVKAKGRIMDDGRLALDIIEKPEQLNNIDLPNAFKDIEFTWKVLEDGHIRAKSKE